MKDRSLRPSKAAGRRSEAGLGQMRGQPTASTSPVYSAGSCSMRWRYSSSLSASRSAARTAPAPARASSSVSPVRSLSCLMKSWILTGRVPTATPCPQLLSQIGEICGEAPRLAFAQLADEPLQYRPGDIRQFLTRQPGSHRYRTDESLLVHGDGPLRRLTSQCPMPRDLVSLRGGLSRLVCY